MVEKGEEMSKKRKRDVDDEDKKATIHELTGPKRKNKLLAQNPDLERAQNGPAQSTNHVAENVQSKEKSKKRKATSPDAEESKKRVHVVESSNVVEVVYDDSAPQNTDEPEEIQQKVEQPPASDLDWLRARTSRTLGLVSDDEESEDDKDNKAVSEDAESIMSMDDIPEPVPTDQPSVTPDTDHSDTEQPNTAAKTEKSAEEAKILRTGRLFMRNLVYGVTEDDLREVFSPYGQIEEVLFPTPLRVMNEIMMIN
jgi:multiple RNA-binding domain-containing protein 1